MWARAGLFGDFTPLALVPALVLALVFLALALALVVTLTSAVKFCHTCVAAAVRQMRLGSPEGIAKRSPS